MRSPYQPATVAMISATVLERPDRTEKKRVIITYIFTAAFRTGCLRRLPERIPKAEKKKLLLFIGVFKHTVFKIHNGKGNIVSKNVK